MKQFILTILFAICICSCRVHVGTGTNRTVVTKTLPPGQAKKITGEKSARKYAPGHNK
jgi:hypothetical protein